MFLIGVVHERLNRLTLYHVARMANTNHLSFGAECIYHCRIYVQAKVDDYIHIYR